MTASQRMPTNTTGLKAGTDLLLWRHGTDLADLQLAASQLHRTTLGRYLEIVRFIHRIGTSLDLYPAADSTGTGGLFAGTR